jgi:hypothetical protein
MTHQLLVDVVVERGHLRLNLLYLMRKKRKKEMRRY